MQQPASSLLPDKDAIAQQLLSQHGPLVGGNALSRLMGFPNTKAFHQARRRQALGIRTFKIEGRRGIFALTADYFTWLEKRGYDE